MKIKNLTQLLLMLLLLTACVAGSDSEVVTPSSPTTPSTPTTPSSPVTPTTPPIVSSPSLLRIPMHYNILLGQPHLWFEQGGTVGLSLREYASAGTSVLKVTSTNGLIEQQLITYRGRNGEYYSAQIQSIRNDSLVLSTPLQQDVYAGANAWNFYEDGSHPNWAGSSVIADYTIRYLGYRRLNQGKHVLLGDSWFSRNTIFERLKQRLPGATVNNKGVGGHTAGQLLSRFDADVAWQNPKYVWILTGTNDYWQDISAATYKSNMRALINKVLSIGAVPIVFDSSVGPLNYGNDLKTRLSRNYVRSVDQLVSEY